jgi:hypothetical protein
MVNSRPLLAVMMIMLLALTACGAPDATVPPVMATAPPTAQTTPVLTSSEMPPPLPTEVARDFRAYQHASGVFGLAIPTDWEVLDGSDTQRLAVRFIPPVGYGSRVGVEVTNEGPLPPPQVAALAESYVHLHYTNQPGYTEINRAEMPDGRLQFVFLYDDGRGGSGRETLTIRQAGPYFTALRVFLANRDTFYLTSALETMVASFTADPLAVWGSVAEEIRPSDLAVINASLWRDPDGVAYYMGEIYNAAPASVADVHIQVALCSSGIVMADIAQPTLLRTVDPGSSTPFAVTFPDVPEDAVVCAEQASASPATPDPRYTTALTIEPDAGYDADDHLVIQGEITNPGLSSVTDVVIILLAYDEAGRMVGFQQVAPRGDPVLAPGASRVFAHTFAALGGEASRYVTLAQARVVTVLNPSLAPGG